MPLVLRHHSASVIDGPVLHPSSQSALHKFGLSRNVEKYRLKAKYVATCIMHIFDKSGSKLWVVSSKKMMKVNSL